MQTESALLGIYKPKVIERLIIKATDPISSCVKVVIYQKGETANEN